MHEEHIERKVNTVKGYFRDWEFIFSRCPKLKISDHPSHVLKVEVGGQQEQPVPDTELREEGINGARLHTIFPTGISQLCGSDVICPVRGQERQTAETLYQCVRLLWAAEALQQFLQHQTRGHKLLARLQSLFQGNNLWHIGYHIAPEGERPDGGVNKQHQRRDRSSL
jgi:hypothetical protein